MASLIDFIDRVRVLIDQPPLGAVVLLGTVADDEDQSLLSKALGCAVIGVDNDAPGAPDWTFAMRFDERLVARRVGLNMRLPWHPNPPMVGLPRALEDLIVSEHRGCVEPDDIGFLKGWWVPLDDDEREWTYLTPSDQDFLPDGEWLVPYRARGSR